MDFEQCSCSGKSLNRLLQPALLAALSQEPGHGYALLQRVGELEFFACGPPDASGVYKALKEMELEGLVASSWDLGSAGPARRLYALSPSGEACLEHWVKTLETYREQIDGLLELLNQSRPPAAARSQGGVRPKLRRV
jgi:DNA-binding PadR family transcriptional regulator